MDILHTQAVKRSFPENRPAGARNSTSRLILLMFSLLLFGGCVDQIIDSHTRNKLVIWGDDPPEGRVGEPYIFRIGARVENTPFDDSYDFSFAFDDGALPPGTKFETYEEDGVDYAKVSGVPTQAGSYSFAVTVRSQKLEREKEEEREEEKDVDWTWTQTVDQDEGLYTIYIVQ